MKTKCCFCGLLYWMIRPIFRGRQRKLAMLCYYVAWSKVKLSVGQKLTKSIALGEPMPKDMSFPLKLILHLKSFEKSQKSVKSMPCVYYNDNSCNFNKNHETKGVFYRRICSSCFAQDGKVNAHSALDCKQKRAKNE